MIAVHLKNGRLGAAVLLASLPAEFFAEVDKLMEAAFVAGMAAALAAKD